MVKWLLALLIVMMGSAMAGAERHDSSSSTIEHAVEDQRVGFASWYGGGEPLNTHVAMGHPFNPEAAEAAMWNIPFGSLVKVTNLQNNRSILVRITDRGPARRFGNRVIDLTRRSFSRLAPLSQGLIPVVVQRVP
ncbi:MAG: septal ring lytic transglycosylase RlpA family lipoprotein [Candidatus Omnitrophica bacterium]|nr:septal ring lytic transglycosylase RlpA family lipoprotein [Candidatus Omnitrophota bacterium]MBI2174412.1 septal ring lytic transglycosylase RlpA family lipoprotein [Candidatus Omnitrophota bacterium]MBI3010684.1 septal ring lytic transglycosylase RlpA family lipoprotein [Candidatus Omnitrophota bacterium]